MRVGVDLQPLRYGASGGIVFWLGALIAAYGHRFPDDELVVFAPDDLPAAVVASFGGRAERLPREHLHSRAAAWFRDGGDAVLLRSYPHVEQPPIPFDRQIVFVPDMQHVAMPHFFTPDDLRSRRLAFGLLLSRCGAVATMTEHARRTILDDPWTACEDVFLAPPAVALSAPGANGAALSPDLAAQLGRFEQFFLMPANLWPHKNHAALLAAFAIAQPRLPPGFGLVLTGAGEGWGELLARWPGLPVLHLGFIERSQVPLLYRRAAALAFFSLYEGFGIPLLEAFSCGTPVVCSDIPPLAEVGGDAVLSCSPDDVQAIAALLVRVATDQALRRQLAAAGQRRLAAYDWGRSAAALGVAIRRVAGRAAAAAGRPRRPQTISAVFGPGQVPLLPRPSRSLSATGDRLSLRRRWPDASPARRPDTLVVALPGRRGCLAADAWATIADHFAANPDCDMLVGLPIRGGSGWPAVLTTGAEGASPLAVNLALEHFLLTALADPAIERPVIAVRARLLPFAPAAEGGQSDSDLRRWLELTRAGAVVHRAARPLAARRPHGWAKVAARLRGARLMVISVWRAALARLSTGWPERFSRP